MHNYHHIYLFCTGSSQNGTTFVSKRRIFSHSWC